MMGPPASSKGFEKGNIVKIRSDECSPYFKEKDMIGTVIDTYVNIDIKSLNRSERVYVLWSDGSSDWIPVYLLTSVSFKTSD